MELHLDMQPRTVRANDRVRDDEGRICVQRGPLIYCAEQPIQQGESGDPLANDFDINRVLINSVRAPSPTPPSPR